MTPQDKYYKAEWETLSYPYELNAVIEDLIKEGNLLLQAEQGWQNPGNWENHNEWEGRQAWE